MGKTAVFVIAALQQIQPEDGKVDTLVMCHTRELAFQIHAEFQRFAKYSPKVKVGVVYGGIPYPQHKTLIESEKPHIVVGTPGRTLALINDGVLKLASLKRFVLDEADQMLDELDMRRQVQQVFMQTPHEKQVMLFSATIPEGIRDVCRKFTKDAQEIFIDDKELTLHGLQQHYVEIRESEKNRKLNDLLDALDFNQVVIFVRSIVRAEQLNKLLISCAFPSMTITSRQTQLERLERFAKYLPKVKVGVVYGGIPYPQHKRLVQEDKPHIVVGTPGRTLALVNDGYLRLNNLKRFVLDVLAASARKASPSRL